jgi:hypothetical protein
VHCECEGFKSTDSCIWYKFWLGFAWILIFLFFILGRKFLLSWANKFYLQHNISFIIERKTFVCNKFSLFLFLAYNCQRVLCEFKFKIYLHAKRSKRAMRDDRMRWIHLKVMWLFNIIEWLHFTAVTSRFIVNKPHIIINIYIHYAVVRKKSFFMVR